MCFYGFDDSFGGGNRRGRGRAGDYGLSGSAGAVHEVFELKTHGLSVLDTQRLALDKLGPTQRRFVSLKIIELGEDVFYSVSVVRFADKKAGFLV